MLLVVNYTAIYVSMYANWVLMVGCTQENIIEMDGSHGYSCLHSVHKTFNYPVAISPCSVINDKIEKTTIIPVATAHWGI